jgi:hypothetical protein
VDTPPPGVACLLSMVQRIGVGYWTLAYLGGRVSTMVGTRYLRYQTYDLEVLDKRRDDFRKIDGRKVA